MRVRALLAVTLLLLLVLPVSACQTQRGTENQTPTPQLVGEWEAHDLIISAVATKIDGHPYILLMTQPGGAASKATLHILDARDRTAPEEVASLQTPIDVIFPLAGIAVSENYLYAGLTGRAAAGGLWVVDISDPEAPQEVTLAEHDLVALTAPLISGNLVVVQASIGFHFALLEVSDPAEPHWLAEFFLDRQGRPRPEVIHTDKVLSGTNLFILNDDGLTAFDVSNASEPRQVSFYANDEWDGPVAEPVPGAGTTVRGKITTIDDFLDDVAPLGSFFGVVVSGDHAFVAASDLGLVVLDVSDTETISELTRLELPGRAKRVVLHDGYAFVLAFDMPEGEERPNSSQMFHPLHVVDVSNPDSPRLLATVDGIAGWPPFQRVAAVGDTVFVTNNRTLHVIDLYAGE